MKFSVDFKKEHLLIEKGRKTLLVVDMGRTPATRRRNWLNLKRVADYALSKE